MAEVNYVVKNKNFNIALSFVQKNYPHLFHERLERIILESRNNSWLGLHQNIPEQSTSIVRIANGKHRVVDFIEILVHELVHVWQYSSGRIDSLTPKQREDEANATSYLAYKKYQEDNGVGNWK